MKYLFKEPLTIKAADKADPQKIGEALTKIAAEAGGELTPHAVVASAQNPRSLLHRHFEWDDAKAAEAYRVDQARTLIASIRVEDEEAEDGDTRAFISISSKAGTSYRSAHDVRNSADLQAIVLKQAERELESFEKRYRELQDICNIVKSAREAIAKKRAKSESHVSA